MALDSNIKPIRTNTPNHWDHVNGEEILFVNETLAVVDETQVVEETKAGLLLEPNKMRCKKCI